MADISIMNRNKPLKWLKNSALIATILLPLSAVGDSKLVVIVAEPPLESTPFETDNTANTTSAAENSMATLIDANLPGTILRTGKPTIRPNIDIFTPREKPIEFITLNSVLFSHNGTALDNKAKRILNDIAAYLQHNEAVERLLINGFADKIASNNYNAKLSAKRAFVVREYLRHIGVPTPLMHTVSWGEARPTDEHWTINGRKRNRRVELYLIQEQNPL
ncbi:MAG: OmpA family protein [Gammaproteobacteria bacterium]|nr:OmpA family protein [Gammaproteobacteria bacterium]